MNLWARKSCEAIFKKGDEMQNAINKFFSSNKKVMTVLIFFLFVPLFFHGPRFGLPYVKGGDEPHYLAMINSFLIDGDLDLRNNYDSARKGSWQIGKKYAGAAVDPHIVWNVGGKPVIWTQVYEEPDKWKKGSDGFYIPERKPEATVDISGLPEYSSHPAGIAFLLAPFLWLIKGTRFTEPLALLCSNLAVIFSAFLFRKILKLFTQDSLAINIATFLTFLGTPIWAYGRTLFMEPYLLFFAVSSFYFVLRKKSGFWAGITLGLGALLKPNFLILFFPIAFFYLKDKNLKTIFWMMVGPIFSIAAILYTNERWYGSPFTPAQPFRFGNIFQGISGLLLSWNHGIITFAPIVLLALLFWVKFFHENKNEASLVAGGFGVYFLMMSLFECWWGGWCYGPRLILPVIPLLMIPILYLPKAYSSWGKFLQWSTIVLSLLSLGFNLLGAFDGYWDSHPLTILCGNVS